MVSGLWHSKSRKAEQRTYRHLNRGATALPGERPLPLRDGTPIRLLAGGKEVAGFVVSLRDRELVVALAEDLGPHVHGATLVADHSGLLEALRGRLQAVADGTVQAFHTETAGLVLGAGLRRDSDHGTRPPPTYPPPAG